MQFKRNIIKKEIKQEPNDGFSDFYVTIPLRLFLKRGGKLKSGCSLICIDSYDCKLIKQTKHRFKVEYLDDRLYSKGTQGPATTEELKVKLLVNDSCLVYE